MEEEYWLMIHCTGPIPGMTSKGKEMSEFQDRAMFEDEEHGDKCVMHWLQFGYPITLNDEFSRKVRIRINPSLIGSIRFWKPFTYELEARKPVNKISLNVETGGSDENKS